MYYIHLTVTEPLIHAQLFVIPGAVTSQLLPLDILVNAPIEELTNEE
jgi:hypothetical protein